MQALFTWEVRNCLSVKVISKYLLNTIDQHISWVVPIVGEMFVHLWAGPVVTFSLLLVNIVDVFTASHLKGSLCLPLVLGSLIASGSLHNIQDWACLAIDCLINWQSIFCGRYLSECLFLRVWAGSATVAALSSFVCQPWWVPPMWLFIQFGPAQELTNVAVPLVGYLNPFSKQPLSCGDLWLGF